MKQGENNITSRATWGLHSLPLSKLLFYCLVRVKKEFVLDFLFSSFVQVMFPVFLVGENTE